MAKATPAAGASRAFFALAAPFLCAVVAAQPEPVVLSVDHVLTHPVTGAIRHEILPVAVYDGARFRAIQEWESPEAGSLLTAYPRVHVLHHGERMGAVMVSDVHQALFPLQGFPTETNGLGGGYRDMFIDAFGLDDGKIFFAFERHFSEAVYFRLYQLGEASETRLRLETAVHGC